MEAELRHEQRTARIMAHGSSLSNDCWIDRGYVVSIALGCLTVRTAERIDELSSGSRKRYRVDGEIGRKDRLSSVAVIDFACVSRGRGRRRAGNRRWSPPSSPSAVLTLMRIAPSAFRIYKTHISQRSHHAQNGRICSTARTCADVQNQIMAFCDVKES